ncbi:LOW QUALITY PROTEIN: Transposase, partial [Phytophthora megakarya]
MKFDPRIQTEGPTDLYRHSDNTMKTHVRPESTYLFTHSASSSFLAYIPLYFWRHVVNETNAYAIKDVHLSPPVTLSEMMKFIGILFFMTINDKGEYENYWGAQPEDAILGNQTSSGLENIMPLRRFKLLRKCFCFRASSPPTQRDPAARIRPLLNLLKSTGGRYINMGRNVALDECSVACRSKYGRYGIVLNPPKSTGKYHFRLSDPTDILHGVTGEIETLELRREWSKARVSSIRQLVLEVARPLYGSNHILNPDNYYTSVLLLQALRVKGLYARGTVRGGSKLFPKHTTLDKNSALRGDYRQVVSSEHGIVAAS